MKKHLFLLSVICAGARRDAELDVLSAFARRSPDGSEFFLHRRKPRLSARVKKTSGVVRKKKTCGMGVEQ